MRSKTIIYVPAVFTHIHKWIEILNDLGICAKECVEPEGSAIEVTLHSALEYYAFKGVCGA